MTNSKGNAATTEDRPYNPGNQNEVGPEDRMDDRENKTDDDSSTKSPKPGTRN